jgi:hypothetical protein
MSIKLKELDQDIVYFIIAAIFIIIVSFSLYKYGFPIYLVFLVIIPFVLLFLKKLDIYINLDKHKLTEFSLVKNPLIVDNNTWLNCTDKSKDTFEMITKVCKKYKTSFVLLRMQLDEITNIRHKAAKDEDSDTFKKATAAIELIEKLQSKDKVLAIRGIGLKTIVEAEGVDDDEVEYVEKIEKENPLAMDGEIAKDQYEGWYKSKLAEGIKNILSNSDKLKAINLISDNPEIRIRTRAYLELIPDKSVTIVDSGKILKSWEYVTKNTPKKFLADYDKKKKDKIKEMDKKKKAFKEKIDFVIKP